MTTCNLCPAASIPKPIPALLVDTFVAFRKRRASALTITPLLKPVLLLSKLPVQIK